jgi:glycosyltransferase involved in cell wall biosynthesis
MKLSVITINYNNASGLRKTLESVTRQTYQDFEYIVIDGGSTDESVAAIEEYADRIHYWISERDNGIYHAMNKGVNASKGEYCAFLNSGDIYIDEHALEKAFVQHVTADIACGDLIDENGSIMSAPQDVTMMFLMRGSLAHPSSFTKRSLLQAHPFNEESKILADHEFFMYALVIMNATYQRLDGIISVFDLSGISTTSKQYSEEEQEILKSTERAILLPRVMADYDVWMGKKDEYHRLFYILSFSNKRKIVYRLVVGLLKIFTLNHGFIKGFHFNAKL